MSSCVLNCDLKGMGGNGRFGDSSCPAGLGVDVGMGVVVDSITAGGRVVIVEPEDIGGIVVAGLI